MPKLATRRKHTNLRLGCLNCKRKKIRCDETLPHCENCARAKRETCSYLSLSQKEINRIRLTHLLRNSQNRLLSQDYRLPISTNHLFHTLTKHPRPTGPNMLEFRFELCEFSVPFPAVPYPALQFHNTLVESYAREYDGLSPNAGISDDLLLRALPNCTVAERRFPVLDYQHLVRDVARAQLTVRLLGFLPGLESAHPYMKTFVDSHIVVGRAIVAHQTRTRFAPGHPATITALKLEAQARNHCNVTVPQLRAHTQCHNANMGAIPAETVYFEQIVLSYSWWCTMALLLLLQYPRHSVLRAVGDRCHLYMCSVERLRRDPVADASVLSECTRYNKHNLVAMHTPLYEPAFLFEMRENLRGLGRLLEQSQSQSHNLQLSDSEKARLDRTRASYANLAGFLDTYVLGAAYACRNENMATTYSPSLVFSACQRWWTMCPGEVVPGGVEPGVLGALRNAVHWYYAAVAVALDAVWPLAQYLFTMGFQWVSPNGVATFPLEGENINNNNFNNNFNNFNTLFHQLWRHNVYCARVSAFFRKRAALYAQNIIYRAHVPSALPNSRLGPRHVKNILELPVRSFNTLPIKPEHYARRIHNHIELLLRDSSVCAVFTRAEDGGEREYVFRPLDLFDLGFPVEFCAETGFCVQDYVPAAGGEKEVGDNAEDVEMDVLVMRQYCEDRVTLLGDVLEGG